MKQTLEHPLYTTLEKLQQSFSWVKLYREPEGENWYSYQDIINPSTDIFAMLLGRYQQYAPYLNKRQAVQNLFDQLSWWCVAACYAPVLIDQRSPDVSSELYFHLHGEGYINTIALEFDGFFCLADDVASIHPKACLLNSRKDLVAKALHHLEALIQLLIAITQQHATIQDKALWLYLADDMAGVVLHVMQTLKQQAACETEVETVLSHLPQRGKTGILEVNYSGECEYYTRRSTCCFYYLKDGKKCITCPKLPIVERLERLQNNVAKRIEKQTIISS